MKLGELRSRVRAEKHVAVEARLGGEFDRPYPVRVQKGSLLELLGQIYGDKREVETGLAVYPVGSGGVVVSAQRIGAAFSDPPSISATAKSRPLLRSEDDDLDDETSADLLGSDEEDDMEDLL